MMGLLLAIVSISGGILLGLETLDKWDGERDFFNKIAGKLAPFQTIIGGLLVVLAILTFRSSWLFNMTRILGGLLLLTHAFDKVPALEASLQQLSNKLMPFRAIIGIALIVLGVLGLF